MPGPQGETLGLGPSHIPSRAPLSPSRTGAQVHRKTTWSSWLWGHAVMEANSREMSEVCATGAGLMPTLQGGVEWQVTGLRLCMCSCVEMTGEGFSQVCCGVWGGVYSVCPCIGGILCSLPLATGAATVGYMDQCSQDHKFMCTCAASYDRSSVVVNPGDWVQEGHRTGTWY